MWKPLAIAAMLLGLAAGTAAAEFRSYAVVQEDASLLIQNKLVRLYGIYIPQQGQFCNVNPRPPFCGTRAAAALDFKIQGFVTCQEMGTYTTAASVPSAGRSGRASTRGRISAPT